jgi:hypothetical protein
VPAPQAGNPETVYQAIIRHFTGVPQSKYWGEKYAGRCIDALKFLDVTDGKIIHTVRDPRDVCASEKRRLMSLRGSDAERHFLFMLYDWTVGLFIGEYISRVAPKRYHRIRYEDLVCDPERALNGICQFLDLPFDTKMVDVRSFSDDEGRAWEANSFFEPGVRDLRNFGNRWKNELTDDEAVFVETFCHSGMKRMGYAVRWSLSLQARRRREAMQEMARQAETIARAWLQDPAHKPYAPRRYGLIDFAKASSIYA